MRRLVVVTVLTAFAVAAGSAAFARPPGAEEILRRAEDVRNPDLDYAVEFTIHGVSRGGSMAVRDASYSMIASGKDRTVILMRSPDQFYGGLVLMAEGRNWMLLPKASKPRELFSAQMTNGDVATGDLARMNLTRGYAVSFAGESTIDGEPCWRLELVAKSPQTHYARVVYWVARPRLFPKKLEYYGRSDMLLKTVLYGDYRKGALGLRSMQLTIESFDEWKENSTLSFSKLRKLDAGRATFTPEGMIALRDAAIATGDASAARDVSLERILRSMETPKARAPSH